MYLMFSSYVLIV